MEALSLIPAMGGLFYTLSAFVIALSIIVFVHEFGHYLIGRCCGIKADVFSVGFGPVIFSVRDKRGTLWQFASIPLGGFVKFQGDKNEVSGEQNQEYLVSLNEKERRATLHGAPLWARSATVAAGPVFNFFLAIIIFMSVFLTNGKLKDPLTVGEIYPLPYKHDFKTGDVIARVNGRNFPSSNDGVAIGNFLNSMPNKSEYSYEILRGEKTISLLGPNLLIPRVHDVVPRSSAAKAKIMKDDIILEVNNKKINIFSDLNRIVEKSNGNALNVKIWRDGMVFNTILIPKKSDEPLPEGGFHSPWRLGIVGLHFFFEPEMAASSVDEAFIFGLRQTSNIIKGSLTGLKYVVIGAISTCNLSGPIGIAETSGQMARKGGESFIWFIGVLSAAVGLVNLLPIPVLDGGHLMFYAYEAIFSKKPNSLIKNYLMIFGFVIVSVFMLFVLANDILCI